jgi:hypothetical protein
MNKTNQFFQIGVLQQQVTLYRECFLQILSEVRRGAVDNLSASQIFENCKPVLRKEREFFLLNIAKKDELKEICSQAGIPDVGVKAKLAKSILEIEFPI